MVDLNSMIWKDGIMFGCKACDYQTQKKAHVKRHLTLKHTPSANLVCEVCNSVYKNRIYLNRHKCRGNPLLPSMDPYMMKLDNKQHKSVQIFQKYKKPVNSWKYQGTFINDVPFQGRQGVQNCPKKGTLQSRRRQVGRSKMTKK